MNGTPAVMRMGFGLIGRVGRGQKAELFFPEVICHHFPLLLAFLVWSFGLLILVNPLPSGIRTVGPVNQLFFTRHSPQHGQRNIGASFI
jgi:hypothetical protein